MDLIKPDELRGSRVYFTDFDRVTYTQVAWTSEDIENIKRELVRKLKLLALTKGHLVIAASHLLESELAREIILPHPELFSERVVVPALRYEFPTCEAFREAKLQSRLVKEADLYRGMEQQEMAQLIDTTALAVQWNTAETSAWFKSRLLGDLRDTSSFVGLILARNGLHVPEAMLDQLEQISSLSRLDVYLTMKEHGNCDFGDIVGLYTDFLYYLSGARAVRSEGILPQENIVDFSLADLEGSRAPLSEHEIFFKIFVDVVKAATSTYFPTDLLDALTIEDAISLHKIASSERFIEKYNAIQETTKAGLEMTDPERLVFLMSELVEFEHDLRHEYQQAIVQELPGHFRRIMLQRTANFLHTVASLVLVPYGMMAGGKAIVISGLRLIELDGVANEINGRLESGLHVLEKVVEGIEGGEKPILLGFVHQLKSRYTDKMFNPEP